MKINHNISALVANGHLKTTNKALDKSLEKLSSGYRINHAADDSAGMAISQKMKTQIKGLDQASRNAADGISVIQTAEGALAEVESMLQRARELSVQAANGTNTPEDRSAIQKEIDQLSNEIQRISDDTEFNTKALLNGNVDRKSYSTNTQVTLLAASDQVPSEKYQVTVDTAGTKANIAAPNVMTNVGPAVDTKIIINGESVKIPANSAKEVIVEKLRDAAEIVGAEISVVNGKINFSSVEAGSAQKLEIYCDSALATSLGFSSSNILPASGTDAKVSIEDPSSTTTPKSPFPPYTATTTIKAEGNIVKITDSDGFEMKLEVAENYTKQNTGTAANPIKITVLDAGPMTLQIGANEGQTVDLSIPEVSPKTLGIENVNTLSEAGASKAITLFDKAVNQVSSIRAKLGAYENRMDHAISSLDVSSENLTEALSRIEDVDMADEMATYTQKNVLAQAGVSMLAQANERPQTILSLLQ